MDHPGLALFDAFPDAARAIPHLALGCLPTPIQVHAGSEPGVDCAQLLIKRDDLSGERYGGNKIRKLEFLLAAARAGGARGVITFGVAGSNHALATSICAQQYGLDSYSLLTRQANASYVRRNLLAGMWSGANLFACESETAALTLSQRLAEEARAGGDTLYVIPGGGSSAIGCLGFVNAGFELAAQLRANDIQPPDLIYLALGTVGTAAGLQLGLRLAGLRSRLVPIRVVREDIGSPARFRSLLRGTGELLGQACGIELSADLDEVPPIRDEFIGPGYARFTPDAIAAMKQAERRMGLCLDPTYTGKAFAALLADLHSGALRGRRVMFWNTYNSRPLPDAALGADYHQLPVPFHWYFEQAVQALDPDVDADGAD
jgi:1-aminocyclopropane-1-carboxylate deaminase/D-cysteine desulfhydrase-like pyridoxal-dependent ACC family enzyme